METAFYSDEEIPVAKIEGTALKGNQDASGAVSFDECVKRDFLHPSNIPIVIVEDEEDDYILLTPTQPRIKVALLHTQSILRSSGFRDRKRPMLSKFPGLKYYSGKGRVSLPESPIEADSHDESAVPRFSFNSPSSNDADESSYDNDQSFDAPDKGSAENTDSGSDLLSALSLTARRVKFATPRCSMATTSSSFKYDSSLRRKSVNVCGALGMSAKVPRRLSRMLLSFGDDSLPKKSRLTVPRMGCYEFNRITRKYSRELVKNVLFIPRGEIRIVRLSEERFYSVQEIAEALFPANSRTGETSNTGLQNS
ncbi:hypothetical protein Y032_0103g3573 [Ancylostoma ceylanicum]|nr:hypothetical protein Y032_0103g3573 [Ancylostoma ceylanicum]